MRFGRAPVGGVHDHSPFKKAARPESPPVTILPSGLRNANQSQYHPRRSKTQRDPPFRAGPQTTPTGSEAVEKAEPRGTSLARHRPAIGGVADVGEIFLVREVLDRKSTRLNSSH